MRNQKKLSEFLPFMLSLSKHKHFASAIFMDKNL